MPLLGALSWRTRTLLAGTGLAATMLVACGPIPPLAPDTLPPTGIPDLDPDHDYSGVDTIDGFTAQQHASVRLRVRSCDGWSNGSGFILDEATVVTNAHVIEDALWIEVTTYDGHDFTALSSQLAPVADLGLVHLDAVFTEFVTLSDRELELGDAVQVVGYPEGQQLTVETGTYEGTSEDYVGDTGQRVHSFNAYTLPGNSGSPIYDADGHVVSVLYASDTVEWSGGWPIRWLKELLDNPSDWEPNTPSCDA